MLCRRKHLGTVILDRWGQAPKMVPDFGEYRFGARLGGWLNSLKTECAPLAVGVALIWVLEGIDLTAPRNAEGNPRVPARQVVAVPDPGDAVPVAAAKLPGVPLAAR